MDLVTFVRLLMPYIVDDTSPISHIYLFSHRPITRCLSPGGKFCSHVKSHHFLLPLPPLTNPYVQAVSLIKQNSKLANNKIVPTPPHHDAFSSFERPSFSTVAAAVLQKGTKGTTYQLSHRCHSHSIIPTGDDTKFALACAHTVVLTQTKGERRGRDAAAQNRGRSQLDIPAHSDSFSSAGVGRKRGGRMVSGCPG